MTTLKGTEARANLYKLIDDTLVNHEPLVITCKRRNVVLLAEDDWNAINEPCIFYRFRDARINFRGYAGEH